MLELYKKIFNRLNKSFSDKKYLDALPKDYSMDDIFLVSYPKSGNTWLRFLIANAIKVHYRIKREVNFFNIQEIVPGLKGNNNISDKSPFGISELPRIIKSHSSYNPHYHRTILLVRDPRDVMVSYYYYLKNHHSIPDNYTISDVIKNNNYGVDAWLDHTNSWCLNYKQGQAIQLFRYEDLIHNTKDELDRLMNLIGLVMKEEELEKAISMSSKEKMKEAELNHKKGATYSIQSQKINFVRQAKVEGGSELSDVDRKFIEDKTRQVAIKLGYEY